MFAAAHQEHFEGVEVGQPVTTENTSFGRFFGEIEDHGIGVADGLYGTKAMQIDAADGSGAIGWHDTGLFDVGSGRMVFTGHMRVDSLPVGDELHIAWLGERKFAIIPPLVSVGVTPAGDLVATGTTTVESGSMEIPVGQWVRVTLEVGSASGHLLVAANLWLGEAIENPTTENRAGRRSGIISNGAELIADGGWFKFGNHGSWSATSGVITLDAIAIDAWAAPPIENPAFTQPGMNWWDGIRTRKADLFGWWDGATVQPVDFLGIWDGTTIQPATE